MRRQGYSPYMMQPPSNYGNLTYTKDIPEFYGDPVDTAMDVSKELYTRGEQNKAVSDKLIMAAELDKQRIRQGLGDERIIDEQIAKIDADIAQFAEGKNYHNAGDVLRKLYRGYASNDERLAAINANTKMLEYKEQMAQRLTSNSKDGDIPDQKYLDYAFMMSHNTAIKKDENGNITGGFQGYVPPKYVDANVLIKDFLKTGGFAGNNEYTTEGWDLSTLGTQEYIFGRESTRKGVDHTEMKSAIDNLLNSNEEYKAWMDFKYKADTFDPNTKQQIPVNEGQLAMSLNVPKLDKQGKARPTTDILKDGKDALEGMILETQNQYKTVLGEELSREDALRRIHKQTYMDSEKYSLYMGIGETIAGVHVTEKQKLMQDNVFNRRLQKAEEQSANLWSMSNMGSVDFDLSAAHKQIRSNTELIRDLDREILNTDNEIDKIQLQHRRDQLEADMNVLNHNLKNVTTNASPEMIMKYLPNALSLEVRQHLKYDDFEKAIRSGDLLKAEEIIDEAYKANTGNSPYGRWQYSRGSATTSMNELMQYMTKDDELKRHMNYIALNPLDVKGFPAVMLNQFKNELLTNANQITTTDGRVMGHEDIKEIAQGSTDVILNYVSDGTENGNLKVMVSYIKKDTKGNTEVTGQYVTNPNFLSGSTGANIYRNMRQGAINMLNNGTGDSRYANMQYEVGLAGEVGMFNVLNKSGNSYIPSPNNLQQTINTRGYQVYKVNEVDPNPIMIHVPTAEGNKGIEISVVRKGSNAYELIYNNNVDPNTNQPNPINLYKAVTGTAKYYNDPSDAILDVGKLLIKEGAIQ